MTDSASQQDNLLKQIKSLPADKGLPPVHLWNPPFCGDIDMRINREGQWFYQGTPIGRESMVRLFSTVLRHDEDGGFYLVTPVEKVRIQVDDAPFVAVSVQACEGVQGQELHFTTNVGDTVILGEQHPLCMSAAKSGSLQPYLHVRDRLNALIHRNVFYELVNLAAEKKQDSGAELIISSCGANYSLGFIDDEN